MPVSATSALVGWPRHLAATLSPVAVTASRTALEEQRELRLRRLADAARDRAEQRLRPTRPRMRALSASPGGRFAWRSAPAPGEPRGPEAVVRPIAVATCDLDRALAVGATPFPMPMHFGHECVAEVVTVGERVSAVRAGDRVIVPFQISCGTCDRCHAGLTANCRSVPPISMYGFGLGGGHWGGVASELFTVPYADGMLVALPPGVEPATAASVADNVSDAYRHVGPHLPALLARDPAAEMIIVGPTSARTLLSGSGPLYAALIARALGAHRVTLLDARAGLRADAERLGLTALRPGERRGLAPAPLVMDASGTPSGLRAALRLTARDGVCTSMGGLHASARIPSGLLYARNATLHVARTHARAVIPEVLALISAGRLQPELVTTHVGPLDDAPRILGEHVASRATKTILTAT